MTLVDLVAALRARGVELEPAGDRLRFRPGEAVTPEERDILRRHKAEVLALLAPSPAEPHALVARLTGSPVATAQPASGKDLPGVAEVLGMPLDVFATRAEMLEIRVPWWHEPLWFIPGEAAVETLMGEGIGRGRIWTAGELQDLLSLPAVSPTMARTVATAKLTMDGDLVAVRPTMRIGPEAP